MVVPSMAACSMIPEEGVGLEELEGSGDEVGVAVMVVAPPVAAATAMW